MSESCVADSITGDVIYACSCCHGILHNLTQQLSGHAQSWKAGRNVSREREGDRSGKMEAARIQFVKVDVGSVAYTLIPLSFQLPGDILETTSEENERATCQNLFTHGDGDIYM